MNARLPWSELFGLHVVKKVGKIVNRRWNLGLGYVDAIDKSIQAPKTNSFAPMRGLCQVIQDREVGANACRGSAQQALEKLIAASRQGTIRARPFEVSCHAGLNEIVAPIVLDGELLGALLCGGFLIGDDDKRHEQLARVDRLVSPLGLAPDAYQKARRNHPQLGEREIEIIGELVQEAALEIVVVLQDRARKQPSTGAGDSKRTSYDALIGGAPVMQSLYSMLDRLANSDSTVLVCGENGTGKELVARAIHDNSERSDQRFVVQNCSAFNDNLLDSELFGHKRGSFTGAISDKRGLFDVADNGTFFLDEIGDMSPALQVKVLRVLQEGTFTPVGDTEPRTVDVRIIAATNCDLTAMVERGEFREDLYYRINVINLVVPPLRDRIEDMDLLFEHFLAKHAKGGAPIKRLDDECREKLAHYNWPGNVRELENEIERLVVLTGDVTLISSEQLSPRIQQHESAGKLSSQSNEPRSLPNAVRELERKMIRAALERHNWNKTRAAVELEISRRNLIRLVQKYELEADRVRS